MHRHVLEARENGQTENQSEDADQNAPEEELVAVNAAEKFYGRQIGQLQIRLATGFTGLGAKGSCGAEQSGNCGGTKFRQSIQSHSTTVGPGILKPGSHERFLPNLRNRR
jgi:hypothetical protein